MLLERKYVLFFLYCCAGGNFVEMSLVFWTGNTQSLLILCSFFLFLPLFLGERPLNCKIAKWLRCFVIGAGNVDGDFSDDIDVSSLVSDCGSEGIVVILWAVDILSMVVLARKYVPSFISFGVNYFFIDFLFPSRFIGIRACSFCLSEFFSQTISSTI